VLESVAIESMEEGASVAYIQRYIAKKIAFPGLEKNNFRGRE
jgi:hypothetical protein